MNKYKISREKWRLEFLSIDPLTLKQQIKLGELIETQEPECECYLDDDGYTHSEDCPIHSKDKPYFCSKHCSWRFATVEELKEHDKEYHSDTDNGFAAGNGTHKPESDKESKVVHSEEMFVNRGKCLKCRDYADLNYLGNCPDCTHSKPQEELEVEEIDLEWGEMSPLFKYSFMKGEAGIKITDKLNQLIKAHNALVKEVKRL